jgi:hypothetical protein
MGKAHQLWGWGRVSSAHEAAPVAPVEPIALTPEAIKNGAGKNKRREWSPEAVALMRRDWVKAKADGEKMETVAEKFGFASRQALSAVVNRVKKGTRSGADSAPMPTIGTATRRATR